MVDLAELLPDEDLRRRYGTPTLDRAWEYVRRGRVLASTHEIDSDGDLDIRGSVAGSTSAPYTVTVSVGQDDHGPWVYGRCSCPVHDGCKHLVALLITVRDEQARAGPDPARRWERQLTTLLDELDERAEKAASPTTPLGLRVDLKAPVRARGLAGIRPDPERGTLRLRPVRRGTRDRWVKSGIEWTSVRHLGRSGEVHPPAQVVALNDLLSGHTSASRQIVFGVDGSIPVGGFGPDEMRLLRRCVDAGVALVPGAGLASVALADPVTMRLDVHAPERADAWLRLGVNVAGEWYTTADLEVLGEGTSVALWDTADAGWAVTLAALTTPLGPQVRRLLTAGDGLRVPAAAREELVVDYLPQLQRHVPLVSSDGTVDVPERPEPRLVLGVDWVAADEVRVRWTWRYLVGRDDRVYDLSETRGLRGVRRSDAEQELLDALVLDDEQAYHLCRAHTRELGLEDHQVFRGTHAILFAEQLLPGLRDQVEVDESGTRPDYQELEGTPVIRFTAREDTDADVEERTDWLDLEVEVTVDGVPLGLVTVLEALTKGMDRVILRNGRHVRIDRPEFARLAELVEAAGELHERRDGTVRVGHRDLGLWDELAEVGIVDAQAAQWVERARALRSLDTLPEVSAPVGLKAELRGYQQAGFRWLAYLWEAGLGGILADDMGLGKTLQTLALVTHARERGADPFLVVAPTSVVSTWAAEAARFTPDLDVRVVGESSGRRGESVASLTEGADVVVTSYTLFRLEQADYVARPWGGLVLDEAQTVKNHQGKTHQAVRRVDAPFRLALTGTPMENRLMELWSLLSIVAPGLYPWPQRFAELVANPVEKEGDTDVLDRFRRRIRPFLLRRSKELVAADLPAKQEQVLEVSLTPRHRRVYDTHLQRERQNVLGLVDDFDKHRIAIFRSLTRLRRLSLDAALVDEAYDGIGSAKVDVLVDHLLELAAEGHRALVFSQFTSFLGRVRDRLEREGIASSYLDGTTRRRGDVVEGFRTGDDPVFLISLKAGGVGLTLTEADYVFVLDPWWNPAVEAQAVDRAHRIGQDKPVLVYRLVATDTIEEKVMALKARKARLFAQVVEGDALSGTPLDADDVRALLET
ncbi:MAG: DEAD/DEAH box helicase [Nocardioidaceae bacterium]|nr:DEAD/DEAH box helicase [Nocardioidaceae bacterium]NUS50281.1 DEAD/DEAH box helicase [Nocardioidaceae bacterium]